MDHAPHLFMPGQTIDAVIKLKAARPITRPELEQLRARFNELNGSVLPRPGMVLKVPLPPPPGAVDDEGAID